MQLRTLVNDLGRLKFPIEEWPAIQSKQSFRKVDAASSVISIELPEDRFEIENVPPYVLGIEAQLTIAQNDGVLTEKAPKAVKGADERSLRRIALRLGPQGIKNAVLRNMPGTVCNQQFKQGKRLELRRISRLGAVPPLDTEVPEAVNANRGYRWHVLEPPLSGWTTLQLHRLVVRLPQKRVTEADKSIADALPRSRLFLP